MKNPLGGLRGAAQLLERQLPDPEQKAYTRVIIEEADRLAALVDGILRAGGAPRPEELNLHRITEHVAQLIEAEKPRGVELVRDYDPSLPPITVDRNQMIQAFLNIARNAMQALGDQRAAGLPHARADELHAWRGAHIGWCCPPRSRTTAPAFPTSSRRRSSIRSSRAGRRAPGSGSRLPRTSSAATAA